MGTALAACVSAQTHALHGAHPECRKPSCPCHLCHLSGEGM